MKFWFDTEFIEDGKTIDLISIGIVAEDGREFYAINSGCDYDKASQWVKDNVIVHLKAHTETYLTRAEIRDAILAFVGPISYGDARNLPGAQGPPEFWAYYADYDWVVLCQLFGTMMDLPKGWPMYCRDVKQLCDDLGNPKLPEQGKGEHHAFGGCKVDPYCVGIPSEGSRIMSNRAVVYKTWSNFEGKACRELYELGIDAEAPRDESGKRVRVTAPGYVFAAREAHHAFLRHVRHKVGIVDASDVANLRIAKPPEPEIKPRAFMPGDRVQINVGPFATMEGIVERDRNRVYMVAIDGLNVSAVSVHPSHMIRIDPG